jgi:hypothetical protein
MTIIGTAPFAERISFFSGQRLFASDLQYLEQFNREMRWLHNQSLHQIGVASGFAVSGNKDDRQVTIQPGYAIDSSGREIVLTQPELLQVPPVANDGQGNPVYYDLAVSYPDDSMLKETETRDGVCVSRSAVRLQEKPVFSWVELAPASGAAPGASALAADRQAKLAAVNKDLESGARIRLARAEVLNCKLNQPLSIVQRRNAKPAAQPFISAGSTPATDNVWTAAVAGSGIMISLPVDASAAQFRGVPRYFAHVLGDRQVTVIIHNKSLSLIVDGFSRVVDESFRGFTFTLLIPQILIDRDVNSADFAAALPAAIKSWSVEWLGIEG